MESLTINPSQIKEAETQVATTRNSVNFLQDSLVDAKNRFRSPIGLPLRVLTQKGREERIREIQGHISSEAIKLEQQSSQLKLMEEAKGLKLRDIKDPEGKFDKNRENHSLIKVVGRAGEKDIYLCRYTTTYDNSLSYKMPYLKPTIQFAGIANNEVMDPQEAENLFNRYQNVLRSKGKPTKDNAPSSNSPTEEWQTMLEMINVVTGRQITSEKTESILKPIEKNYLT